MTEPMLAFHSDPAIKDKYLARVRAHRLADNLVQGIGWDDGKGCAVRCTLETYDHSRYPVELGIPIQVAYLEDRLFELQTAADAQGWPERFLSAIRPGADLVRVWPEWAVWMLVDEEWGVIRRANSPDVKAAIREVARLWRDGGTPDEFRRAAAHAQAHAHASASASASAAYAASSAAAYAASSAAYAAYAASSAAYAYAYAASSAAYAYAYAAADAGRARWTRAACDKLIAILEAA